MRSLQEGISQNGRRYHSYGSTKYWGPDDEAAQDIQDLSHTVWSMSLEDHLFFAPMEHPKAVLDIGTGTGIWVIDVADQYPEAFVTGIDLSAIQPLWIPRNCDFEVDDFNEQLCDWTKPLSFDLIHARELHGTVPDWTAMYRKVYDKLEPGGWFDQAEPSILFLSDLAKFEDEHCFARWNKVMIDAGKRAGLEIKSRTG
jgi:trans-aconitate methyltransferase